MAGSRWKAPLAAWALAAAVGLVYSPLLTMPAGFIWDDDLYVTGNRALESVEGLGRLWLVPGVTPQYYPLVFTTFWVERRLWGLDPIGYHATNIVLHAVNAVLAWRVLRALRVPGAWVAGLVFAVHPVQVESVAWVSERKNVLSTAFYLASLLAYLRFSGIAEETDRGLGRAAQYALALIFFLGALFSKTVTASLPAAILVLVWWKRGRIRARDVLWLLPFFVLGLGAGLGTIWMERFNVGAVGETWNLPVLERLLVAGRALWFYLAKLAWPWGLAFTYPRWSVDRTAAWQYAFPLAGALAVAALWRWRGRIGRAPVAASLLFGGTLVPALGFFAVFPFRYSYVADHFQYLASLAPIALAVGVATSLARPDVRWRRAAAAIGLALVLGSVTAVRCRAFENEETVWRDTLAKNPDCWLATNNLGRILYERGDTAGGLDLFRRAQRLEPGFPESNYNLGYALVGAGDLSGAEVAFEQALAGNPGHVGAHQRLGTLLFQEGRVDEAIEQLGEAVCLDPQQAWRRVVLARALLRGGRKEEGLAQLREASRIDPSLRIPELGRM